MRSAENGRTAEDQQRMIGNRYLVHEAIGRGGYGVVWRGYDTLLGREVALKEVRLVSALSSTKAGRARSRMMQEARASAVVSNAHAITVYDIVQDDEDGDLHIVMELLDGRTLTQLVEEEGCLTPQRAATVGLQVLEALRAAHAKGVVHRDVKPSNVMVLDEDRAKLGDFGLASLADGSDLTMTGEVVGTPAYMAPEQASDQGVGPPADLWGLGATLYYAVEGVAPFGGQTSVSTMHAVVNAEPRPYTRAGALAGVLDRLLAKLPWERPGPDELRALLTEVADGAERAREPAPPAPAEAPPGTTAAVPAAAAEPAGTRAARRALRARAGRRRRTRRVTGAVIALAAVAAVLVAVVVWAPGSGGPRPAPGGGPGGGATAPTAAATTTPVATPTTSTTAAVLPLAEDVTANADEDARRDETPPAAPPSPAADSRFRPQSGTSLGQGNPERLPAGSGTIDVLAPILDETGRIAAAMQFGKFRVWDGTRVVETLAPEFGISDTAGQGITFVDLVGPVVDEPSQGGKVHTTRAVALFRACEQDRPCTDIRVFAEVVAYGDGTYDTRHGPV